MPPPPASTHLDAAAAAPPTEHFLPALIDDGCPLLFLSALALMLSGAFALFLSATGAFLPQDLAYLRMDPASLCGVAGGRVARFMFHDRVAFGGTLVAIGTLYLWLTRFPLRRGEEWAWWTLLVSAAVGFASFLCYLGYGYLDTWHGAATLGLLPLFVGGLWKTRALLPPAAERAGWRCLLAPAGDAPWRAWWQTRARLGRACLLLIGGVLVGAGAVIMLTGMTVVFVLEDLAYLGLSPATLDAINARLVPLIAHDRAGFGGGLACCGLTVCLVLWKTPHVTPALWQALALAGGTGFACAIGVHYLIGYLIPAHLLPAWAGAAVYALGMWCLRPAGAAGATDNGESS